MRHPLRRVERDILLSVIDNHWVSYLHSLDNLREGIGLRAYGQKDPLNEYKSEAFSMFQELTYQIQRDLVMLLFNTRIEIAPQDEAFLPEGYQQPPDEIHQTVLTEALGNAQEVHADVSLMGGNTPGHQDI